jgi:hypothetical protein
MRILHNQTGYVASGFRLIYGQAFNGAIWDYIQQVRPRIVNVRRFNVLRQGISYGVQQLIRWRKLPYHPVHSFEERIPDPVAADPSYLLSCVARVAREMKRGKQKLAQYGGAVLRIFFEDMIDGPVVGGASASMMGRATSDKICGFLGVRSLPLTADLRRDYPLPLRAMFSNWPEIEKAILASPFSGYLDLEAAWVRDGRRWVRKGQDD